MGSDDLQSLNVAVELDIFSWTGIVAANDAQLGVLFRRWVWILIDEVVLSITGLLGPVSVLGYDLGYLVCAVLPATATWMAIIMASRYASQVESGNTQQGTFLHPVLIILAFATAFIHFFNGIHVESYVMFLFASRLYVEDRNHSPLRFIIDCAIVSIKPYYAIIVLALIVRHYSLRALFLNGVYMLGVILPTVGVNILVGLVGHGYSDVPFSFDPVSIAVNVFQMNFGITFGLLWCYLPAIILCGLGARIDRDFIQRLGAVFVLQIFLASVNYWHGGIPGNRYLAPLLFIFIPEMVAGWHRLREFAPRVTMTLAIMLTLVSLPILEFRNTAVREYSANTFQTGNPVGYDNYDEAYFNPSDIALHPVIFANVILITKLTRQPHERVSVAGFDMKVGDIYPTTVSARMLYLASKENESRVVSPEARAAAARLVPLFGGLSMLLYSATLALVIWVMVRGCGRR